MDELKVGGTTVDRGDAREHARHYLTDGSGWSYPSYDGYDAARANGPLVDTDLLAPLLLNVTRISVKTYEALTRELPSLQSTLNLIPAELSLTDAGPSEIENLGNLFSVLDTQKVSGAKGAVLSKLLHRKRPAFIPLYDVQVWHVYASGSQPSVPLAINGHRSWQEYIPLLAGAIQADLKREIDFWNEIAALASGPPITPLRALDIVAWWAGGIQRKVETGRSSK